MPPTRDLFRTMWEVNETWMPRIRALCDAAEQEANRGAAQVVGRQAGGDLTARLAGNVEQERGLRAVVLAQASWASWACRPGHACRDYWRVLDIVRDHGSHDCRTVRLTPSGSDDNYR